MEKHKLMVEGLDGETKVACRLCGCEMIYRDLGVTQYVQAGELIEQDHGGFWECTNTKCGHQEE